MTVSTPELCLPAAPGSRPSGDPSTEGRRDPSPAPAPAHPVPVPLQGCYQTLPALGSPWPDRVQSPGPGSSQGGRNGRLLVGMKQDHQERASEARLLNAGLLPSLPCRSVPRHRGCWAGGAPLASRSCARHSWFSLATAVERSVVCIQNHRSWGFFFLYQINKRAIGTTPHTPD